MPKVRAYEATHIYRALRFRVDPKVLELDENENTGRPTPWLTLEHAYPAQWMADALNCGNTDTCGSHSDDNIQTCFNHAEADMHNLCACGAESEFRAKTARLVRFRGNRSERLRSSAPGRDLLPSSSLKP